MENKLLVYGLVALSVMFFIGSFVVGGNYLTGENSVQEANPELDKYRSEDIPKDCRIPIYETDVRWWKEHLSHHKPTWYCLDYYKDVEDLE